MSSQTKSPPGNPVRFTSSCAPRPASRDSGPNKASGKEPMTSSRRSTAGLPRASIPPTSRTPRRCSTSWRQSACVKGLLAFTEIRGWWISGPSGEGREDRLHRVQPGARGRREVEDPARVAGQPGVPLGVLVGSVVVEDHVTHLAVRTLRSIAFRKRMNSWCGWRAMQRPITRPSRTLKAANKHRGRAVALVVVRAPHSRCSWSSWR